MSLLLMNFQLFQICLCKIVDKILIFSKFCYKSYQTDPSAFAVELFVNVLVFNYQYRLFFIFYSFIESYNFCTNCLLVYYTMFILRLFYIFIKIILDLLLYVYK